ncbi:PAS domain S-box protein [Ectothiorhodospiraceae bacterium WFHF3C12]|nr:PAS domain S-box protein [Ectothiorhodospiraceae bacterium WFHF3C12]
MVTEDARRTPPDALALQALSLFHELATDAASEAGLADALSACAELCPGVLSVAALQGEDGQWTPLNPLPGASVIELGPVNDARPLSPGECSQLGRWLTPATAGWLAPFRDNAGHDCILVVGTAVEPDDALIRFLTLMAQALGAQLQRFWLAREQAATATWLEAVIQHMAEGVVTLSADGAVIDSNESAQRILGRSREELRAIQPTRPQTAVQRPDGGSYQHAELAASLTLATGEAVYRQVQGITLPDGAFVWLSVNSAPLYRRGDPRPHACILSFHDITDLIQTEQALRRSEERYRALVETAPEAIVIYDPESGAFVDVNANAETLFGMPRDELLGLSPIAVSPAAQPDGRPSVEAARERLEAVAQGEHPVFEWAHVNARGGTVYCEVRLSRLPGQPALVRGSIIDITQRKAAEQALIDSEHRYRTLVENAPEAMVVFDFDANRIVDANDHAGALFGMSKDALYRVSPTNLYPPRQPDGRESAAAARRYFQRALEGERPVFDWTLVDSRGRSKPCEVRLVRLPAADRRLVQTSFVDISERQRAAEALRASEKRFRALYHDNPSIFITLDAQGRIRSANRFGAELLGYSEPAAVIGDSINRLFLPEERDSIQEHVDACFASPDVVHRWETRVLREDGGSLWVRVTARVMPHPDRGPDLLLVCQDITEARNLSAELTYQATHDALTGLLNRPEFERRLIYALDDARSNGSEHALCYLDLDQFKIINDTCGHIAGDELLRQLAREMTQHVSKRDVLARMGGDEFGVLLEHCASPEALRLAERLRGVVESFPFAWEGRGFRVGVSIGLVPVTPDRVSLTEILSLADTACYAAKDEGRNRIHLYHPEDEELARRHGDMEWVARLRQALEEDRMRLFQQPIAPLQPAAEPEGAHYELLVRLVDEDGEIVPPGAFLPAAEQYNMATTVDEWVVRRALAWLAADPRRTEELSVCSINLSGHSLRSDEFLQFLLQLLDDTGVPAERICFEITETAAIGNLVQATRFIEAVKARGCRFALDDFGSGLSSFGYLKNLPVDYLKIDGIFVKDITDDPIDLSVVRAINEIGQVMGKKTIAEFVETEAIMARLAEIGVDYVQGYAVGRPGPLESD